MSLPTVFPPGAWSLPRDAKGWVKWPEVFEYFRNRRLRDDAGHEISAEGNHNIEMQCFGDGINVMFYNTCILAVFEDGTFDLQRNVVESSRTTRKRLDEFLPYGCKIAGNSTHLGYCLRTPRGVVPLSNKNVSWNEHGRIDLPDEVNKQNYIELTDRCAAYAKEFVRLLLQGELYWDYDTAVYTCDQCGGHRQEEAHLLKHLNETRRPPVELLLDAIRHEGYPEPYFQTVFDCTKEKLKRMAAEERRAHRDPENIVRRTEYTLATGKRAPREKRYPKHYREDFERVLMKYLLLHLNRE